MGIQVLGGEGKVCKPGVVFAAGMQAAHTTHIPPHPTHHTLPSHTPRHALAGVDRGPEAGPGGAGDVGAAGRGAGHHPPGGLLCLQVRQPGVTCGVDGRVGGGMG